MIISSYKKTNNLKTRYFFFKYKKKVENKILKWPNQPLIYSFHSTQVEDIFFYSILIFAQIHSNSVLILLLFLFFMINAFQCNNWNDNMAIFYILYTILLLLLLFIWSSWKLELIKENFKTNVEMRWNETRKKNCE